VKRAVVAILALVAALTPALAAGAQAEITRGDIEAADAERRAISAELSDATAEYEASVTKLSELEDSLTTLGNQLAAKEQELADARVAAREIAVDRYMHAGVSTSVLFGSGSIDELPIRAGYLDILSREGTDTIIRLYALEDSYRQQQDLVAQALADQERTSSDLDALATSIMDRLDAANAAYDSIVVAYQKQEEERKRQEEAARQARLEEERRRAATSTTTTTAAVTTTVVTTTTATATTTTTAPPGDTEPPPSGSLVCPVDGAVAFTDTWGAARSGGRSHEGVDMIASRGTPAVAIETGTIKRMGNGGLGGITVWITGASGDEYYYAHLDGWAEGLTVGQAVTAGDLVGYVGNTGNARYTVTHLHFEYHPGGGSAVNPYPLVAGLCL
jgi:murein DD-endopeptidase MepM/ murein hydrolase activator NlpD